MLYYIAMLALNIFFIRDFDESVPKVMRILPWIGVIFCVLGLGFEITDAMVK